MQTRLEDGVKRVPGFQPEIGKSPTLEEEERLSTPDNSLPPLVMSES